MKIKTRVYFNLVGLLMVSVGDVSHGKGIDVRMQRCIEKVKQDLGPLCLEAPPIYSDALHDFFDYYGLNVEGADHFMGTFVSGPYTNVAHIFIPPECRGTVLLVHGYYDHSGGWQHVIRHLVKEKYTVAVYDQPGHGLSSGARASITDFSQYVTVVKDVMEICARELVGPYHVVAHSAGCSAVIDHILDADDARIDRIVLIAPLIRSVAWTVSGVGNFIGGAFFERVPRTFRKNSSDNAYMEFVKEDPLHARYVPLKWVDAHRDWCKSITGANPSERGIKIIQGGEDSTVAWEYNLKFLEQKFPQLDVSMVRGGGHQLINESKSLRQQTLDIITQWLNASELEPK
jgi:alpha-beta hydrolase superfamily lysophospholipase